jgi:hypothetical protein
MRRFAVSLVAVGLLAVTAPASAQGATLVQASDGVTYLSTEDFTYGTYIIDEPGTYRLTEDISFNPNSPATLTAAVEDGLIPGSLARALGLSSPVDAYHAGHPLPTQMVAGGVDHFTPGGPLDARYDPAAFGLGFFAAIAVTADDVVIDLDGHTLEQSAEHALLQRYFAVIELADQPFVPGQGPASFGAHLDAATRVTIKDGTIGRSAHHGIHGNGNADVTVDGVDFDGYEVAAVALNGVDGLSVSDVTATNRKDVPVVGTFSPARFITAYVDHLVDSGSPTTLQVDDAILSASDVQTALQDAINNTHHDLVADPNVVDGRAQIDAAAHPVEYALFHNPWGLPDGNSYSFLVNHLGVAVNGFPSVPDGTTAVPSRDVHFEDVEVHDQRAAVQEVIAVDAGGSALIDPAGAVFQIRNLHPDTGAPITISDLDDAKASYLGNPVANAQALVAKAAALGEFEGSHLDVTRSNMPATVLDWIEGRPGSQTLADIAVAYYCNGDPMFHVNKGVIAFKMDAAEDITMTRTSVEGLANSGGEGSTVCGDYRDGVSHPLATLHGYGGSAARGYTFAGSTDVRVEASEARAINAAAGPAIGFAVMTDTTAAHCIDCLVHDVSAGSGDAADPESPTQPAQAIGFSVSAEAGGVNIERACADGLSGTHGESFLVDESGSAVVADACQASD